MTEFESLVRPFQSGEVTPAQTYYTPGQVGVPNVILRIGRSGSGKVMTGSDSLNESNYISKYETESIVGPKGEDLWNKKFGQGTIGDPMKPGG